MNNNKIQNQMKYCQMEPYKKEQIRRYLNYFLKIKAKHENLFYFYILLETGKWYYLGRQRKLECIACRVMQPNQQAHMENNNCMSEKPQSYEYIWRENRFIKLKNKIDIESIICFLQNIKKIEN